MGHPPPNSALNDKLLTKGSPLGPGEYVASTFRGRSVPSGSRSIRWPSSTAGRYWLLPSLTPLPSPVDCSPYLGPDEAFIIPPPLLLCYSNSPYAILQKIPHYFLTLLLEPSKIADLRILNSWLAKHIFCTQCYNNWCCKSLCRTQNMPPCTLISSFIFLSIHFNFVGLQNSLLICSLFHALFLQLSFHFSHKNPVATKGKNPILDHLNIHSVSRSKLWPEKEGTKKEKRRK